MANNFEMPLNWHYTHKVAIVGRRNDRPDENILSIECSEGDALAYFDMLKLAIQRNVIEYLLVKPIFLEERSWLDSYKPADDIISL